MENVKTSPANYKQAPSIKASDLFDGIHSAIDKIAEHANKHQLQLVDAKENVIPTDTINQFKNITAINAINNMTQKSKKKLAKRLQYMQTKLTLKGINTFFSFLRKKVFADSELPYVKFVPSKAEQNIITARTKYKALRVELELARQDYRKQKADYKAAGKSYIS